MEIKMFEVRDKGTFIPVMCISMEHDEQPEQAKYLLGRAGFNKNSWLIELVWLGNNTASYDPFHWHGRTMHTAHLYIQDNWKILNSGDVIDVEYILKETDTKKTSESEVTYGF